MQMMDSIKKGIRRMAMSAAILTAPFAQANTAESHPEETERARVTMTESHQDFSRTEFDMQPASDHLNNNYESAAQDSIQLARQFSQLLDEATPDNQVGRDNLASFLVEHYSGLKKIESDSAGTPICQQFLLDRQQLYQNLRQKVENGTADALDKLTLSAISVKDQGKLNQFLNEISYDSVRDQGKNPTIYRAVTGLVGQMNEYMDVFKIHPASRLTLSQTLFQNFAGASDKTDCLNYGNGIEVNTNKLAEFLEKTGATIETDNGIRFVLNSPDGKSKEGFEISMKKADMLQSMQCVGQAYHLLCGENTGLNQEVNMIFQEVVQKPGIDTLRKLPGEISRLIDENQDSISPEVREQVGQYLTQATQIPFTVNFHDTKGTRPATKADAAKFVDIVLDTIYEMDDAGVIDISAIAKQNKGSTIIGWAAKSKWLAKRALKGDIIQGFNSFLDQRDEALLAAKTRQPNLNRMLAQSDSNPESIKETQTGSKTTPPKWDMASMVAMNGGR